MRWTPGAICIWSLPLLLIVIELSQPDQCQGAEAAAAALTAQSGWLTSLLRNHYNLLVVFTGTTMLGMTAGAVGTLMVLRRRALVADVVSHAALPGIALAFMVAERWQPGTGRSLPLLLLGAAVTGLLGVLLAAGVRRHSRIKEDAALAIVLSIFFGLGIVLFTVIQKLPAGNTAGLHHFIFGKAASLVASDLALIGGVAGAVLLLQTVLFKELSLLTFDASFAAAQGWPVRLLDFVLMALVVVVTVIGLQSVGILLVVALMIIPAAAARFWTDDLRQMTWISAAIGGTGCLIGVGASATLARMSLGAVIVIATALIFVASLLIGRRRGLLWRWVEQQGVRRRVGRDHLLRAIYEDLESAAGGPQAMALMQLEQQPCHLDRVAASRRWSAARLDTLVDAALRERLLQRTDTGQVIITSQGAEAARQAVRNHRLWEHYLVHYADLAPSHVDRDADQIEHFLGAEQVSELERLVAAKTGHARIPPSPHEILSTNEAGEQ